jgi:hypothetical protein
MQLPRYSPAEARDALRDATFGLDFCERDPILKVSCEAHAIRRYTHQLRSVALAVVSARDLVDVSI